MYRSTSDRFVSLLAVVTLLVVVIACSRFQNVTPNTADSERANSATSTPATNNTADNESVSVDEGVPQGDPGKYRAEGNLSADSNRRAPPKTISGGVLNGKAISLPQPPYPPAARAVKASGAVSVQVTVDEDGNVESASAMSGHPLLRAAAVQAARQAKFRPTLLSGQPVKVTGVVTYNFSLQ